MISVEKLNDTTYEVIITVEGEDDYGNDHETVWTLYLDVEKEKHHKHRGNKC